MGNHAFENIFLEAQEKKAVLVVDSRTKSLTTTPQAHTATNFPRSLGMNTGPRRRRHRAT